MIKKLFNKKSILQLIIILSFLCFSQSSLCDQRKRKYHVLKKYIIEYNTKHHGFSLEDDSYRGEEGILKIRPDVARDFGIKVIIDDNYLEAKQLFKEADEALEKAESALEYRGEKESFNNLVKKIVEYFIVYKENALSAKDKIGQYKARLTKDNDERFNNDSCERVIDKLLNKSFLKTNNNLRDGLGLFYNQCQGINSNGNHVTTENISFVNYVFKGFTSDAPEEEKSRFDIDKNHRNGKELFSNSWKKIAKKDLPDLVPFIERAIQKTGKNTYKIDPLLFMALMKKESDFNPLAVSGVGAAGLTQIMPQTAIDLGLKNIYIPDYFHNASDLLKKERTFKRQAREALFSIKENKDIHFAERARILMLKSIKTGKERKKLFSRYKKELITKRWDDRLHPSTAIEYGLTYFARLMKSQNGDISLALASYNAGPHRVKQYNGIPPYDETVGFRNRVLKYYMAYLDKIEMKEK